MFILLIFVIFLYYYYGWSYAIGACVYAKENNNGDAESENSWQTVRDEFEELKVAIIIRSPIEIFMEFFDVLHAIIKYLIVTFLPKSFYLHPICWLLVFPIVLPIGIKLANRYNKYKCIRNHYRSNKNHKCLLNKFLKEN